VNGDALQRFTPGQGLGTLRADTMNALVDAAKIVRAKMSKGQTGGRFQPLRQGPGSLEVLIRNDTGATLSERSVVELTTPLADPLIYGLDNQERPAFAADAPTGATSSIAVTVDPLGDGDFGRAVVLGVALADLSVVDAGHEFCGPTATETGFLTTSATGPIRILWKESGTGNKLGIVLLQDIGADQLNTQNVDGTAAEADTADIQFDQSTYIKAEQLTGPKRTRVLLDLAGLSDGLVMDKNLDVVTSVCAELTLTPEFSAVPGETHLMTGVTGSVAIFLHKRNVTLLSGTTIGEETCVLGPSECCTPGPTFTGCSRQFPGEISVTMSGATGSCTCFAGTITLEWNPAYGVAGGYEGTFTSCTGTVTIVVYPDASTPTTWTVVWSAGSYTFDSATVSQSWAFACDPISSGTLTQTVVSGCSGSFSFVVGE
jgi:hypothetical protein